ncbi:MAG TPA: cytochrome c [Candidatus Elarobacter sp.]|jgi:mono/diheme cytochrome c family protein|nr:cytochrome c [Candidatus Elarobacter sp.]
MAIALVVVVAVAAAIVVVDSNRELAQNVTPMPPPTVLGRADVARGRHLFTAVTGCVICHRADGGGGPFMTDAAMAIVNAANLTRGPGGVGVIDSDGDLDRALRRGVRPDGTRLLIMPSWDYAALSDDDAASIVAYIRSLPPVDRVAPRPKLGPIGRILIVTHKLEFDATRLADEGPPPSPPPAGVTAAYGKYLARIGGCMACHGVNLSGGHLVGSPSDPPAANLTPTGIGTWSQDQFVTTLRSGKDPSGHQLDPFMPWRTIGAMTDDELAALYDYLKTVPAKPPGNG